ncbi:MAG TPA: serine/threonine-protein kinase [Pirellulales bacterium]
MKPHERSGGAGESFFRTDETPMTPFVPDSSAARLRNQRAPAREYSLLWQSRTPLLEEFLTGCDDIQASELAAVVRVDLRQRLRRGSIVDAREYLARFPALAADPELAADVVYAEFLIRENLGERPNVTEFSQRYPELAEILTDQVRLHQAFDEPAGRDEAVDEGTNISATNAAHRPDRKLEADYEILEELGRGAMGVVYKARQPSLNRLVALKMVRRADLTNEELLVRFRSEAEVVASLHHPQIVQVYDYGQHEEGPYLALELVDGGTLAQRLDGTPWNPRRAAELIEQLARTVSFAHGRGVVHRDLKPNNLLIAGEDAALQVKIADFGLAKVFRDQGSDHTHSGTLLGTPSYMAPEQAAGRVSAVGPASDVYALGAILYELLSGRPPFRGETAIDTLQQVLLAESVPIKRLVPALPRDLATICTKCLERDVVNRYASAQDLADDLRRFLADRPIHARPSSRWEHAWRWCRRNRALAAALGSVALLLLAVSIVSMWYSNRLSRQLEVTTRVELAEREAKSDAQLRLWDAYLAEIAARNTSRQLGQRFEAIDTIKRARLLLPGIGATAERQLQLRNAAIRSLSLPDLRRTSTIWEGEEQVHNGAVARKADLFALNLQGQTLFVARFSGGAPVGVIRHELNRVQPVFSPDARFVAVTGERGTRVWRITDAGLEPAWSDSQAAWLSFVPAGAQAVVSRVGIGVQVVDAETGALIRTLTDREAVNFSAYHSPSRRLAVCTAHDVDVFAWDSGELVTRFAVEGPAVQAVWHPNGECVAVWSGSQPITLWHLRTRRELVRLQHRGFPHQMQFSADGARLVSCSLWDSKLMLWDVGTGQRELEVQGFVKLAIDCDAEGQIALLKPSGTSVELWELASGSECRYLPRAFSPPIGACNGTHSSPDSRLLAVGTDNGVELWDAQRCQRLAVKRGTPSAARFDRQGNLILASYSGIYRWPRQQRVQNSHEGEATTIVSLGPPERISGVVTPTSLATSEPDQVLVFLDVGGWHAQSLSSGRERVNLRPSGDPRKAAVNFDERLAAVAGWETPGASIWDISSGNRLAELSIDKFGMLEFSRDGRWLATTPGGVQLWRTTDWTLAHNLRAQGTTPNGLGIAFSPDSSALAIAQPSGEVRLVDPQSGADWAEIVHPAPSSSPFVTFAPNQRRLAITSVDQNTATRIWNLTEIRRSLGELELDWPADVLQADETEDSGRLEVEWIDGQWSQLQSALRTLGTPMPGSDE